MVTTPSTYSFSLWFANIVFLRGGRDGRGRGGRFEINIIFQGFQLQYTPKEWMARQFHPPLPPSLPFVCRLWLDTTVQRKKTYSKYIYYLVTHSRGVLENSLFGLCLGVPDPERSRGVPLPAPPATPLRGVPIRLPPPDRGVVLMLIALGVPALGFLEALEGLLSMGTGPPNPGSLACDSGGA